LIYITGDTHCPMDIHKLNMSNFLEQKNLTKNDFVIICGDAGFVWDNNKEELHWRNWLKEKNFTTLFVDGNHENFQLLNNFHIQKWNDGKVHIINDSIIHLMRGQVFNIHGLKFFTMGGAESIDKHNRKENISWWKEEIPSYVEFEEGFKNLDKNNWNVDFIISHTCSNVIKNKMTWVNLRNNKNNDIENYFDILEERLLFKHWYFGHYHEDVDIDDKHTLLYERIIKI
jgi:predicted phosphodiesterase